MLNFMEFRHVEAELFHGDRRTVITKQIASFRNFAKAPKRGYLQPVRCPRRHVGKRH
jgi:hypothetical protein